MERRNNENHPFRDGFHYTWLMGYLIVIITAYILGCSNMAFYLSKIKKVDLRSAGSGNLGASNAMILMGWPAGIAVGLHDVGKATLAVLLARSIFADLPYIGAVAGVACVMGHMFPFFLGFKGGKGFASYIGMVLGLNWKFALVVMVLVVLVTLITDYIVVGTVTTTVLTPIYMGITQQSMMAAGILLIATAVILYKHRENFVRLANGTEIGLRKGGSGKHRVKKD